MIDVDGEVALLLALNREAHLRSGRVVHSERARHFLLDAAVAELNAVFR